MGIGTIDTADLYPTKYRSLVEAILEAAGGQPEVPAQFGKVGGYFSAKVLAEGRWWSTFINMIDSAREDGVIIQTEKEMDKGVKFKWLTLKAPSTILMKC